ncbi:hypothetical protein [Amycolatopsis saalfeldensis]|uniref:Uncharacterized protein n=1 Tax=Amycolatopsis saalfeldensis TaxID=394193 RepID=A0A1H8UNP3_9PSEU|nr:hypothetical protein [Amycolatopsis saalfeldensis]SEP04706.1 hypothetical protein SAMN04489732_103376 [Amycolatopsis saalfeldensis]
MVQYTLVVGGLPLAGAPAYLAFLLHRRRWGTARPPLPAEELRAVADVLPRTRPVLPPVDGPGAEQCAPCLSCRPPIVPAPRRPESAPVKRAGVA